MKPAPFEYRRAGSVEEALALLAEGPEARLIAGGQTLMPILAMRLARPTRIVDILRIPGLDGIAVSRADVTLGATCRQIAVERSEAVAEALPLLALAMPWVGHPPTRRRGTVGGSIANADPAAEIALVAVALDADILLAGPVTGSMPAAAFLLAPMVTALPDGAMVTGIRFPRHQRDRRGAGFQEIAMRHGDYALAAAAAELALDGAGRCAEIRVAVGGATPVPVRLRLDALVGTVLSAADVRDAIAAAIAPLELLEDPKASAAYRRRAAAALAERAVAQARAAAAGESRA